MGIAGKVLQSGSIREISGLNIRISGEIKGCGEKVMAHVAGRDGRITDIDENIWEKVIAINLRSVFLFCN